ncbi:hypothetical protein RHO99_17870 [Salmonella enterica subsp. enterica serovar Typhimurium]|nr:hypothetical protein [Salmonella enterica subsp. enterica serovar Typhimurium]MDR5309613.1 hypothetical protein [Salmonella enterica subsp. enterica serovar Typhimurium]
MKLKKDVLFHKIMQVFAVTTMAFSLSACATLLDSVDLDAPTFTNQQAVDKMEDTIKAHAALDNTTPGPLQTVCNYDDSIQEDETYHCTTYVKESSVVLYADCTEEQCTATGYDQVEKSDE